MPDASGRLLCFKLCQHNQPGPNSISNQELFKKHLCNPCIPKERKGTAHPSYINYHLKSEVSITLCCQLCSTHYTQQYESRTVQKAPLQSK